MRCPDSGKLSSHMISDYRWNLSRVETLGNFIKKKKKSSLNLLKALEAFSDILVKAE